MDTQNSFGLEIKEEPEQPTHYEIDIKTENYFETPDNPEINEPDIETEAQNVTSQESNEDNSENPFSTVHLSIKEEVNYNAEVDNGCTFNLELERLPDDNGDEEENDENVQIKEEQNENLVNYDYPSFDDTGSMDSNEATALGNVETCMQDEIDIKSENEDNYQELLVPLKTRARKSEESRASVVQSGESMENKRRKVTRSEGREIIAKVYHFLKAEYEFMATHNSDNCDLSPLRNIRQRTANATGVSIGTVARILKEEKCLPSSSTKLTPTAKKRIKKEN